MPNRDASKPLLAQRLKRLTPRPVKKFAEKIGVDPRRYYAWLAGERPPDSALAVIARMLNVSLDDLLTSELDDMTAKIQREEIPRDDEWEEVSRVRSGDIEVIVRRHRAAEIKLVERAVEAVREAHEGGKRGRKGRAS